MGPAFGLALVVEVIEDHQMEVIYTPRTTGFERGKSYRNPAYFTGNPEQRVTSVKIEDGTWPEIAEAYEAAGIPVETDKPQRKQRAKKAEPTPEQQSQG